MIPSLSKTYKIRLTEENIEYLHKLLVRDKKQEYSGKHYGPQDEQIKQLMLKEYNEEQRLAIARATMTEEYLKDHKPVDITPIEEKVD